MTILKPAVELDRNKMSQMTPAERIRYEIDAILAHRPDLAAANAQVAAVMAGPTSTLPRRLTELVRLRIAFFNQCRTCMSLRYAPAEVSEGLVCSLERPQESADLSDGEKVAIKFAEVMATDHLAIDAGLFDELRRHYSEAQIVELCVACALHVGFGRMGATWQMYEHLPERFQQEQDAPFTPWGGEGIASAPRTSTRSI